MFFSPKMGTGYPSPRAAATSLHPDTGQGTGDSKSRAPGPSAVPARNAPTGFAEQLPPALATPKQGEEREENFSSSSCGRPAMQWCPLGWVSHHSPAPTSCGGCSISQGHPKTCLTSISQGRWAHIRARLPWWLHKCPFMSWWHLPAQWVGVGDLGLLVPHPCSCW